MPGLANKPDQPSLGAFCTFQRNILLRIIQNDFTVKTRLVEVANL